MIGLLCALPFLAGLLPACAAPETLAVGYVEGEYVNLAPVTTAELTEVAVRIGDQVRAGQIVARQDRADAEIAVSAAAAARAQAAAELANLREGSRPEEIAVIAAQLDAARVSLAEAARTAARQSDLAKRGVIAQATLDSDTAARDRAETAVAQLEAELAVARLPARPQVVAAAESRFAGAEAAARQAEWQLEKRALAAPVDGEVTDVFRRVGELAGPTTPVLAILPEGAIKLVVFVGEAELAGLSPGDALRVRCDGCPAGLTATISYVSDQPEFTPPVIYSVDTRQKLIYRIEARPAPGDVALRPGQIVDAALP